MATYRVRLFAAHREAAGRREVAVDLAGESTVADIRQALEREVPALRRLGASTLIAVNGQFAGDGQRVRPHDDLAVFPPVAGG